MRKRVKAFPIRLTLSLGAYHLVSRIYDGPESMKGRIVDVEFQADQLDKIDGWEAKETGDTLHFELPGESHAEN